MGDLIQLDESHFELNLLFFLERSRLQPLICMFFPLKTLKTTRIKKGVTQLEMAEHLNISLQFYSQIERGVNRLSYKNALKIAEYLNCSTDELFKEDFKGAEL